MKKIYFIVLMALVTSLLASLLFVGLLGLENQSSLPYSYFYWILTLLIIYLALIYRVGSMLVLSISIASFLTGAFISFFSLGLAEFIMKIGLLTGLIGLIKTMFEERKFK